MVTGQCLCGSIRFETRGLNLRGVAVCHCRTCRRQLSGPMMAVRSVGGVNVTSGEPIWYMSSDFASRGFCGGCGTTLFYHGDGEAEWSINAGTLDEDPQLPVFEHIFADHAPSYYTLPDDGVPRTTAAKFFADGQKLGWESEDGKG